MLIIQYRRRIFTRIKNIYDMRKHPFSVFSCFIFGKVRGTLHVMVDIFYQIRGKVNLLKLGNGPYKCDF